MSSLRPLLRTHLLDVEMLTDIVEVLKLKCGINTPIFFAITMGRNREVKT
jgi:hypothetical protein